MGSMCPKNLVKRNASSTADQAKASYCVAASNSMVLIGVFVRVAKSRTESEFRSKCSCLRSYFIVFFLGRKIFYIERTISDNSSD